MESFPPPPEPVFDDNGGRKRVIFE